MVRPVATITFSSRLCRLLKGGESEIRRALLGHAMPFRDYDVILIDYINPLLQKRDIPVFFSALSRYLRITKARGMTILYLGRLAQDLRYSRYRITL